MQGFLHLDKMPTSLSYTSGWVERGRRPRLTLCKPGLEIEQILRFDWLHYKDN